MKIFCTEYPLLKGDTMSHVPDIGQVFMRGDSCINNSGKVTTAPWWSEEISTLPLLVVKVGKVGRAFEAIHAEKYYSEVALGVGLADCGAFLSSLKDGKDPSHSYNFDGSLFLSPFCPKSDFPTEIHSVSLCAGERVESTLPVSFPFDYIRLVLAYLSRYYLMKMGDLVTFPLASQFEPVTGDLRTLFEGHEGEVLLDLGVRVFGRNFTF